MKSDSNWKLTVSVGHNEQRNVGCQSPAHLLHVNAGLCAGLKKPDAVIFCQLSRKQNKADYSQSR